MPFPRLTVAPVAWRPLAAVAIGLVVVQVAFSSRYGYHRDELYFLASGRHPAWGYPDQPPLTPLLARLGEAIGRGSLAVFRLPANLAAAGTALLTGLLARELGGRAFAQILAAVTAAVGTFALLSGHLLLTSSVDLVIWVALTWLVLRLARTGQRSLWVPIGVVAGVGLLNKQLVVVLLFGLGVGLLASSSRRVLLGGWWLVGGVVIASAAWAPVLGWQATHGWPQVTLAGQIRAEYGTVDQRIGFLVLQVVLFSLGATALWVLGVVRLWRDPGWRYARVLLWCWAVVLVVFIVTAGQGYYPAGTYPGLIAAGAVVLERHRRTRRWAWGVVLASSALTLPAALPILSPAALGGSVWSGLAETQRETVGWPQLVDTVAAAYHSLPSSQQSTAAIFADNYGEAGAVDRFGPDHGLPNAWSGLNGYGLWGPPSNSATPVVVIWEDSAPDEWFTGCHVFAKIHDVVDNEESQRASVYLCAAPVGGWSGAWPRLRHLSN